MINAEILINYHRRSGSDFSCESSPLSTSSYQDYALSINIGVDVRCKFFIPIGCLQAAGKIGHYAEPGKDKVPPPLQESGCC